MLRSKFINSNQFSIEIHELGTNLGLSSRIWTTSQLELVSFKEFSAELMNSDFDFFFEKMDKKIYFTIPYSIWIGKVG